MNKIKIFLLMFLLISVVQLSNSCLAAQNIDWSSLNLSEEQLVKVGALDAKWNSLSKDSIPKISKEQENLRKALENPKATTEQIREANKNVLLLETSLQNAAMENFLEKRSILTDKQKKKLLELLAK